tara:strand:+ start:306 stop:1079 length:774 start_codon:yes stop_codon:yes gene_type:complete
MSSLSDNQVTIYEEPVQEKVRKFLKIEYLFDRIFYFKNKEDRKDNYNALLALAQLYEILSRSDIKSELIREIETHNTYFIKIKKVAEAQADLSKLNSVLEKQDLLLKLIYNVESNYLDYLDDDVLCKTIIKNCFTTLQPASIEFWLTRDIVLRETQIDLWLEPLLFIKKSVDFILEIIRKSATFNDKLAEKGFFIEKLDPKKNILLVRVTLTSDLYYYPQISVGKQRLNIMFMSKDDKNNLVRYKEDVPFILTTCVL